jgi:excisionase family DNA binding protein
MTGGGHLLRVGEAAEILGVDARQVYEAIDAGDLPASHVQGRGIRLRPEDVEDYAEAD